LLAATAAPEESAQPAPEPAPVATPLGLNPSAPPAAAEAMNPPASVGSTNAPVLVADAGGGAAGGGNGGGFRPRRYIGPGSASDVVVGTLAPGVARPKVFQQAKAEKPTTPEEGALALFAQALFASAEFRYLQ